MDDEYDDEHLEYDEDDEDEVDFKLDDEEVKNFNATITGSKIMAV